MFVNVLMVDLGNVEKYNRVREHEICEKAVKIIVESGANRWPRR